MQKANHPRWRKIPGLFRGLHAGRSTRTEKTRPFDPGNIKELSKEEEKQEIDHNFCYAGHQTVRRLFPRPLSSDNRGFDADL